ncbi:MAG TPA: DUF1127 domain-containing protein [Azospirillum sp.]|nr:DUF1127 domain-containing protein [Azospirillum sp.]
MSQSTNSGFPGTAHSGTGLGTSPNVGNAFGRFLMGVADTVATWNERRRQRLALVSLPDHLLSDIGVSRADADHEAEKPFWQG